MTCPLHPSLIKLNIESFPKPRLADTSHHKTITSYLTIKLGRLGLYTVNQEFKYVNVLDDANTEQSGVNDGWNIPDTNA